MFFNKWITEIKHEQDIEFIADQTYILKQYLELHPNDENKIKKGLFNFKRHNSFCAKSIYQNLFGITLETNCEDKS